MRTRRMWTVWTWQSPPVGLELTFLWLTSLREDSSGVTVALLYFFHNSGAASLLLFANSRLPFEDFFPEARERFTPTWLIHKRVSRRVRCLYRQAVVRTTNRRFSPHAESLSSTNLLLISFHLRPNTSFFLLGGEERKCHGWRTFKIRGSLFLLLPAVPCCVSVPAVLLTGTISLCCFIQNLGDRHSLRQLLTWTWFSSFTATRKPPNAGPFYRTWDHVLHTSLH